ncbi:MoaD/ThiS family protein [Dethiobacter alkaliphilus]|uniref:ThiamineS protein n=1 Tax=Dethiobacter alkaliphilus AHT 1 TaxID=555088 RepID=C0GC50_DETAL|nr:MoaD/ThiS family protein [Dethiobacter alkaliphilus]EEG78785.1 thiamineS protein [Dethiobacter alkaliphilus AHT 1]
MKVIRVFLHNFLDTYSGQGPETELEILDGWQVRDVLAAIGIEPEIIGVVLVNKKLADKDTEIKANDRVDLYPLFGGG